MCYPCLRTCVTHVSEHVLPMSPVCTPSPRGNWIVWVIEAFNRFFFIDSDMESQYTVSKRLPLFLCHDESLAILNWTSWIAGEGFNDMEILTLAE
jgi:hypothetical protein